MIAGWLIYFSDNAAIGPLRARQYQKIDTAFTPWDGVALNFQIDIFLSAN